jgi:hypothetical protein
MTRSVPLVALLVAAALAAPVVSASAQTPTFDRPALVTAAGQSAEVTIAGMLFKKANVAATVLPQAKAADLTGHKTLVLVPGFSSKGLGSAGIDKEQEMARVKALIAAAQKAKMPILTLHIGGKNRRGTQSDDFNREAALAASYVVVVKAGDEDQFFTKLAAGKKIPIELVDRLSDAQGPIGKLFK